MNKIIRIAIIVVIPITFLLFLNLSIKQLAQAWGPLLTFLLFWSWLFIYRLIIIPADIDTGTYGGILFFVIPILTTIGVAWGLIGLLACKWSVTALQDIFTGRYYLGISLLLFCAILSFQLIFRKKPVSGSLREGGRIDVPKEIMESHDTPIIKAEHLKDTKSGSNP